jgi:hypothetical protein
MKFSPTPEELRTMPYSQLRRLVLSTEKETMSPQQLAIIALRHVAELNRTKLVIHKGEGSLSLRKRGRWRRHPWEISARDFKRLSAADKRRIEREGIPVVEEYSI